IKQANSFRSAKDTISFTLSIKNTGEMDADEVAQVYVHYPNGDRMPVKELKGYSRVTIPKGEVKELTFNIPLTELEKWDLKDRKFKLYEGQYKIVVGSHSLDNRLEQSINYKSSKKKIK